MEDIIQKRKDCLHRAEEIIRAAEGQVDDIGEITIKLLYRSQYPRNVWVDLYSSDNQKYPTEMKIFSIKFFANRYFNKLKEKYNLTEKN